MSDRTCIAIPTLRALKTLRPLVRSLLRDPAVGMVLVLDNGHKTSPAKTWLRQIGQDPRVTVIDTRGWGIHRMWNWGREWATEHGFEFYGAFNDDLVVPDGLVCELACALTTDPRWWIVSPDWHRRLADGVDVTGTVRRVRGTQRHDGIAGWCWVMRTDVPVPPIDETFRWWYGDDSLAEEIHRAGGQLGIVEGLPLDHEQETTAKREPWTRTAIVEDGIYYEQKYGPGSAIPLRVSVLIPTKDRPDRLRRAVEHVLAQDYPAFEVIVQNGGGPVDLPDDPRLIVVNEPDKSIAHALNLAAKHATGDIFHVAMDDDWMCPNTLWSAQCALRTGEAWTYGWMRIYSESVLRPGRRHWISRTSACLWEWSLAEHKAANSVNQPTAFFTRAAYEKYGPFNEDFPLVWDYEWWMRLAVHHDPVPRDHCDSEYTVWPGSMSVFDHAAVVAEVVRLQALWAEKGYGER